MKRMPYKWILLVLGVMAAALFFRYYNPEQSRFALRCPFLLLTGYECPGCGSQRAMYCFMHGKIWEGVQYNYLLPPSLVYAGLLVFSPRDSKLSRVLTSRFACWTLLVVIMLWWILRNVWSF